MTARAMRILEVPTLEYRRNLTSLTLKPLEQYNIKYLTRDNVRPFLQIKFENGKVSCRAKWNEENQHWEGKLDYNGNSHQWVIREV